jgi:glycosyltransferase involved in cell wall biosynthesis
MNINSQSLIKCRKNIAVIFPKDSESIFNNTKKTFGGATVQLFNYAMELSKHHNVYCLINEIDVVNLNNFPNINLRFTFNRNDNFFRKIIKFHRILRDIRPDVIIQRGLTRISTFLAFYCILYKILFIFMFAHDRECRGRFQRSNRFNIFYPFLLLAAKYLIVQNDYQEEQLNGFFKKKIFKITNGYPINEPDLTVKSGVLWVSRIEPWKRPEICIEAAMKNPDINFTMIAPVDNQCKDYAVKIYKMACNIKNITIIDFVSFRDIDNYFRKAKLFLNTSEEEGFPNTFIQACKNKTPIISLSVNPNNFLTVYNAGRFCNDDTTEMNRAIDQVYHNEHLYQQYAESAVEYAKNYHCIEKNVRLLEQLFVII